MNVEIKWAGGDTSAADMAELNKPHPAVWCERCQCVHAARPAGYFDAHMSAAAKEMADRIDAQVIIEWEKTHG